MTSLEVRERLLARYGFALDRYQLDALDALDRGGSVLVAAPTGSGKTVVAEYAVARAVEAGRRAFYTTPIKALSNQKYNDLVRIHGADQVGLLTGDNAINPGAAVVVMTTEVLRNMIYGRSAALASLDVVVLDEVHFLQDTYRGPVWEEVIVHLDAAVKLVCLSATVSNAVELADWITEVRGPTAAVIEETRPVTLHNLYLIGDKTSDRLHLLPMFVDSRPNPEAARIDGEAVRGWQGGRHKGRRKLYTPRRLEVIEILDDHRMLPAIYFIFSRNACSEAAQACNDAGLRLTTGPERDRIREIARQKLSVLDDQDLAVLGYARFIDALENGIAAHHAGMVPLFKEAVEACFVEGLVKVVFATETLAVGINMPARTVVIEKMSKFTGDHHATLTAGEYTQLTGRAGRRGIDDVGHAVVLWSSFVPFDSLVGLASSKSFHLTSAFRPTYNMTANLVRSYTKAQATELLNRSFAQYQADRDVVRLHARLARRRDALASARSQAASPCGDIEEYRRLTTRRDRRSPSVTPTMIEHAVMKLRPGDIFVYAKGRASGRAAVLSVATRKNASARVRAITSQGNHLMVTAQDFAAPPRAVGAIELPKPYEPNRQSYQRDVARMLDRARTTGPAFEDPREVHSAVPEHPVSDDPDLTERLRAAAAADRIEREIVELEGRVAGRATGLIRAFDSVVAILTTWGYVDQWLLTSAGERLARLFHECDLLIVEAIRRGLLDGLKPAELAGLVSVFTYEHRSPDAPPAPWFPSRDVTTRWRAIDRLAKDLRAVEESAGLNPTRYPDPTFVAVAYAWASGEGFAEVVEAEELSGGDFVRNIRQLVDLLKQIAELAPEEATRRNAASAAESLVRGVVAASGTIELPGESSAYEPADG